MRARTSRSRGQRLLGDSAALADTVAGLARAFGAEEAAPGGDPFARHGLGAPWNDPASAPGRAMSAREFLMGTSFRAVLGQGTGSQLTSWGQGATVSHYSGAAPGLSLSGEAATGTLGMDYERGPAADRVRAHAQPRRGHRARCRRDLCAGEHGDDDATPTRSPRTPTIKTIQVEPYIQWLTIVLASVRGIGTG